MWILEKTATRKKKRGFKETHESSESEILGGSFSRFSSTFFYLTCVRFYFIIETSRKEYALTRIKFIVSALHYLPRVWMRHFIGLLSVMQKLICREEEDALFYLTQGKAKAYPAMRLYCRRSTSPHRNTQARVRGSCSRFSSDRLR